MSFINRSLLPCVLFGGLTGCQCLQPEQTQSLPVHPVETTTEDHIPVQRYGRYTLVELRPQADPKDLFLQTIDVDFPGAWVTSVADALRYVLLRSGYRLCESTANSADFQSLPLPAAHQKLGPMVLRDAVQVLIGSAWSIQVDEKLREICLVPSVAPLIHQALQAPASVEAR